MVAGPFEGHEGYISAVAFSADNKHVISGSYDDTIRVWDVTGDAMLWIDALGERRDGATVRTEILSDSLVGSILNKLQEVPLDRMQLSTLQRLQATCKLLYDSPFQVYS